MGEGPTYTGTCFCGAVEVAVTGTPLQMGYCHCNSCKHWSAAPINAFSLWKPDAVRVVQGEDVLATFNKTEGSFRRFCKTCGGHVMNEHPTFGFVDVYASFIPELDFEPAAHINYGERMVSVRDGLPKFKDFPTELGGSGEQIDE